MVTSTGERFSNFRRNAFIAFVAAGALLLFASARAQSIALPVAGMIALLLPALTLIARRWRRPALYLAAGAVYAFLAGLVRLAGNDVTTVVSTGFALAALLLLGAAVAISALGDIAERAREKALTTPTAIDALVDEALSARGLQILAAVTFGLAILVSLSAAVPGSVWGSHAIGQLTALAAKPWLGAWWGAIVAIDGLAGGLAIFFAARSLGASVQAAVIAGLLWAMCPARVWPLSLTLAPTFLVPVFCWAMIAGEQNAMGLASAGAAFLVAVFFAPAEAIAMLTIGAAFAIARPDTRTVLRDDAKYWWPWVAASLVVLALARDHVARALSSSGALLGSADAVRGLGGDGAPPWEAVVPASLLAPFMAAEHHAGVALALCISPGLALVAAALAFVVLRPISLVSDFGRVAALAIAFGLYAALPSQWAGVALPTLATALAALVPGFAGIAQAGLGISVICALLGALALDVLFSRHSSAWRTISAAAAGLAVLLAPVLGGPSGSRLDRSPTIEAESWAAEHAGGGAIAYYPFADPASPRGSELALVEAMSRTTIVDLHASGVDRARILDLASTGLANRLRAHGVKVVIVEARAYGDPLVTPSLSPWVWLPGDLRTARQPVPRIPPEFSPIQAFDDGAIIVYAL
ncbi:MAG TPA: hypothetical protein VID19_09320 [Candidatus Eremiobacteraceae bacterium]|jgi:hypothetical protein